MSELTDFCDRIRTVADEAFGPFPRMTATEAMDEIEKGICEYKRAVAVALAALERLRDCDWVITPHDRMDAVRDIARDAIAAIHNSSNPSHHDGAAPAPSVDGVVGTPNQKGET